MALKKNNFISALIAIILWIFFRAREDPIELKLPEERYILLQETNFHLLQDQNWLIIVKYTNTIDKFNLPSNVRYNVAFLNINDYKNAKIAAMLQIRNSEEFILLKNGRILSCLGDRRLRILVEWHEIFDYILFSFVLKIKIYLESLKTKNDLLEISEWILTKIAGVLLNFLSI